MLYNGLKDSPRQHFDGGVRMSISQTRRYVYPDAFVVCGPPQFDPKDSRKTTLINPPVAFDVLSESTEAYDRGETMDHYRRVPTLEEYFLISQSRPTVQSFLRQADRTWNVAWWRGLNAVAKVHCLSIDLPLGELYANIDLLADPSV